MKLDEWAEKLSFARSTVVKETVELALMSVPQRHYNRLLSRVN